MLVYLLACAGSAVDVGFVGESGTTTSCIEEALTPARAALLTPDGCGYMVNAFTDDEQIRFVLDTPAFASLLTDGTADATWKLPDDAVRLEVETGCRMRRGWCGESGSASAVYTYTPTAGTVQVTGTGLDANVVITGLSLVSEYDDSVTLEDIDWSVTLYGAP